MIAWCIRKECEQEAVLLPVVLLWPHRVLRPNAPPARIELGMPFCQRCSRDMKVEDLIGPGDWQSVFAEFIRQRNTRPDVTTARLEWMRLDSREALEFIRSIPAPEKGIVH